jgi:hypothetical protein
MSWGARQAHFQMANKQEERLRRVLSKEVSARLRPRASASGWRQSQGWLFRQDGAWFVEARGTVSVGQKRTTVSVHVKPMGIDPIFWDIVGTPDNIHQPLSFRMFGAWTCSTPPWSESEIDESGLDPGGIAASILATASIQLGASRAHRSLSEFLAFLHEHSHGPGARPYLASVVCAHVLAGDLLSARHECIAARDRNLSDGFQVGRKRFADMAIEWLEAHPPAGH